MTLLESVTQLAVSNVLPAAAVGLLVYAGYRLGYRHGHDDGFGTGYEKHRTRRLEMEDSE